MRKTIIRSALAAAIVGISAPLSAHAATYGLGIQAGTLGIGPDLNVGVNKYVGFDLGLNTFSHNYSSTESGIEYGFKAKLNTVHLLANVYPFGGIFHVTAGVVSNGNKFDMSGKPTGGSYTINNTTYSAAQVGTLDGKLTFPDTAGYVGVGWGLSYDPQSHWGFNFSDGCVVIRSGEDDPADMLTPRLLAAGADAERVHAMRFGIGRQISLLRLNLFQGA